MTDQPRRFGAAPRIGAAAAITVAGGTVMVGGQPVSALDYVVDSASALADGPGVDGMSLADAVTAANSNPGADTITFDPDFIAALTDSIDMINVPRIGDDLTIVGPGRDLLTLTSTEGVGLYSYNGADFTLSGITISDPVNGWGPIAGIRAIDAGTLRVEAVTVTGASTGVSFVSGLPGAAAVSLTDVDVSDTIGVGLYLAGTSEATLSDVTVSSPGGVGVLVFASTGDAALTGVTVTEATESAVEIRGNGDVTIDGLDVSRETEGADPAAGTVLLVQNGSVDASNVLVANATAAGFTVEEATDTTLADVEVSFSGAGVTLTDSGAVVANGVTVSTTAGAGLTIDQAAGANLTDIEVTDTAAGIAVTESGAVVVDDVTVTSAAGAGLKVDRATSTALQNIAVSNGTIGVHLLDTGATTLADATLTFNADTGLIVDQLSGPVDVARMTSTGNGVGMRAENGSPLVEVAERDLTIRDSTIADNGVGGIKVQARGDIALDTVTVTGNGVDTTAPDGGVVVGSSSEPTAMTITDSTITGNVSQFGGGLSLISTGTQVDVVRTTVTDNIGGEADVASATSSGESALEITDSVIGATIGDSPGFFAQESSIAVSRSTIEGLGGSTIATTAVDGGIAFSDSTITGNVVAESLFDAGGGSIGIERTTVAGNALLAPDAGVFARNGGTLSANTSILTGNDAPLVAAGGTGPAVDVDYSLVPVGTGNVGTDNVLADDPLLGPFQDNGGPRPTMLPSEESPALDIGDPAIDAATTDQRGFDRVVDGRADAGSVERQQSPFVVSLPPARILETRVGPTELTIDGDFEGIGRRTDGQQLTLPIAGRAGVPSDAKAVAINVTAVDPSDVGFVTVHPCEVNPPLASSLNFRVDVDSGNEIVAELTDAGELCLFNRGETDLVVDVVGYVPADSRYLTVGPARLLDTRGTGVTIDGQFQQGGLRESDTELTLKVAGRGGVSPEATAVVINVTAVKPEDVGYVTVHPCLPEEPTAASLNFEPGVNRGNEIVAQLDGDGNVCLYTYGSAQLVVDVVGQLSSENTYEPVAPARLVDTRQFPNRSIDGVQQDIGRLDAVSTLTVDAAGRANVPADAKGVVVNVTAIRPSFRGFITVWDCTGTMPLAASLNFVSGEIVGNELVVDVNSSGNFCIFTSRATDLTVDVVGYLT